jgi:thiamine-phosphate pyrophosphorylase
MVETARAGVASGVTMVQLRDKDVTFTELVATTSGLMGLISASATAISAAPACALVRRDPWSVRREQALVRATDPDHIDYFGIGPVFATPTKPDHEPPIGIDRLRRLVAASSRPAVAIGGLKGEHAADVVAAGVAGMAVVLAICAASDAGQAARELAEAIAAARRLSPISSPLPAPTHREGPGSRRT